MDFITTNLRELIRVRFFRVCEYRVMARQHGRAAVLALPVGRDEERNLEGAPAGRPFLFQAVLKLSDNPAGRRRPGSFVLEIALEAHARREWALRADGILTMSTPSRPARWPTLWLSSASPLPHTYPPPGRTVRYASDGSSMFPKTVINRKAGTCSRERVVPATNLEHSRNQRGSGLTSKVRILPISRL
jgi:hypothetical protein